MRTRMKTNRKYLPDEKLTPEQKKARRMWQSAQRRYCRVRDLLTMLSVADRAAVHAKVDHYLDGADRAMADAEQLDPDVESHLTLASETIWL